MLADGVGGALKPIAAGLGLFGRQHFDKALREGVEGECGIDVPIERDAIELGKNVDAVDSGMDAIAEWNID